MPIPQRASQPDRVFPVPNPRPALADRGVAAVGIVVCAFVAAEILSWFVSGRVVVAIVAGSFLLAMGVLAFWPVKPRRLLLRVEDGALLGLWDERLPVGEGEVQVTVTFTRVTSKNGDYDRYAYAALYVAPERTVELGTFHDPVEARQFAEGVCRAGQFTMAWTPAGDVTERRSPSELDLRLWERLARSPDLLPPPPPGGLAARLFRRNGEGRLSLAVRRGKTPVLVVVGLSCAAFVALVLRAALTQQGTAAALVAAFALAPVLLFLAVLANWSTFDEIVVEPRAIVRRTTVFGREKARTRHPDIEGVYVERATGGYRLVLASDRSYTSLGVYPDRAAAAGVRALLLRELAGVTDAQPVEPARRARG